MTKQPVLHRAYIVPQVNLDGQHHLAPQERRSHYARDYPKFERELKDQFDQFVVARETDKGKRRELSLEGSNSLIEHYGDENLSGFITHLSFEIQLGQQHSPSHTRLYSKQCAPQNAVLSGSRFLIDASPAPSTPAYWAGRLVGMLSVLAGWLGAQK